MRSSPMVKNRFVPSASATTSTRASGHQSAISRQCRSGGSRSPRTASRAAARRDEARDVESLSRARRVAVVAVEELHAPPRAAERSSRSIASGQSSGSTSQTAPVHRRARGRSRSSPRRRSTRSRAGRGRHRSRIVHLFRNDGRHPPGPSCSPPCGSSCRLSSSSSSSYLLIQIIPYGRDHSNPPTGQEPKWSSPQRGQLTQDGASTAIRT